MKTQSQEWLMPLLTSAFFAAIHYRKKAWVLILPFCLVTAMNAFATPPERAGEAIFTTGEVSLNRDGEDIPLHTGVHVQEGDRVTTGPESHVHLRMVDGAFISLRSDSALRIDAYRYTPETPGNSMAKITLLHGVARSVTGEIGARDKERVRFNTPVAAIGIRGTDFSVMTSDSLSRMSVRRGGVVMAPLSPNCDIDSLGPCGTGATELFAQNAGAFLETKAGNGEATLTYDGIAPDEYAPPHPREQSLGMMEVSPAATPNSSIVGDSAPEAESYEEGLKQVEHYLSHPGLRQDARALGEAAGTDIQPRDHGLADTSQIAWGRWGEQSGEGNQISRLVNDPSLNLGDDKFSGTNSVFALRKIPTPEFRLPDNGRAHFKLNRYDAVIKRNGRELEDASISQPGLVVDFATSRFASHLVVHADSLPTPIQVVGEGEVTGEGSLVSNSESPSRLVGGLTDTTTEAGLLFEYQIEHGVNAVGATHWMLKTE